LDYPIISQYQTKICEAVWNIHGKSIPMVLRKITFVMGQQGQKIEKTARHNANISDGELRQNTTNGL
jgi:hypothetical protein